MLRIAKTMLFELNKIYVFTLLFFLSFQVNAQEEILGFWYNDDSTTIIEIYMDNGLYNGRVTWLKESLDTQGNSRLDVYNDNASLRSRELLGIDLIYGFQSINSFWRKGKIYDYKSGRTYNGKITLKNTELRLSGYYGILFFLGKTKTWYRVK